MIKIEIPGFKCFELEYLLLDYNGTIAVDGKIDKKVAQKIQNLAKTLSVYVLTADTHGTVLANCKDLLVNVHTFSHSKAMQAKLEITKKLGQKKCVAIGNGRNDYLMLQESALSIGVIGTEGASGKLLAAADIVVTNIYDALDLLLYTKRIIATLRG